MPSFSKTRRLDDRNLPLIAKLFPPGQGLFFNDLFHPGAQTERPGTVRPVSVSAWRRRLTGRLIGRVNTDPSVPTSAIETFRIAVRRCSLLCSLPPSPAVAEQAERAKAEEGEGGGFGDGGDE